MESQYTIGSVWFAEPTSLYNHYRSAQIIQLRRSKDNFLECYVHYIDFDRRLDEWVCLLLFLIVVLMLL